MKAPLMLTTNVPHGNAPRVRRLTYPSRPYRASAPSEPARAMARTARTTRLYCPHMLVHAVTPILNVSDVEASIAWFESLGWAVDFTWPDGSDQAGFGAVTSGGNARIFLCRGAQGA